MTFAVQESSQLPALSLKVKKPRSGGTHLSAYYLGVGGRRIKSSSVRVVWVTWHTISKTRKLTTKQKPKERNQERKAGKERWREGSREGEREKGDNKRKDYMWKQNTFSISLECCENTKLIIFPKSTWEILGLWLKWGKLTGRDHYSPPIHLS